MGCANYGGTMTEKYGPEICPETPRELMPVGSTIHSARIIAKPGAEAGDLSDLDFCKCGHQRCLHLEDGCGICKLGDCKRFDNSPVLPNAPLLEQTLLEPTAFLSLATELSKFRSTVEVVFETDRDGHLLRVQVFGKKQRMGACYLEGHTLRCASCRASLTTNHRGRTECPACKVEVDPYDRQPVPSEPKGT
jgi:hypothetical protein